MSDETDPVVETDTSVPVETQETTGPNWQERYDSLRPEFDRKSQRLSEFEQAVEGLRAEDPDTRQAAAQFLGIEFAEDEDELDPFADPTEALAQEIAAIKAELAQRNQSETQQQIEQRDVQVISHGLQQFRERLGRDLSEDEIKVLGDAAWSDRDEQGLPNIDAAVAAYERALTAHAPKQRPRAPHISASGTQAEQTVRLDDPNLTRQQRHDLMYERLQANEL